VKQEFRLTLTSSDLPKVVGHIVHDLLYALIQKRSATPFKDTTFVSQHILSVGWAT
jgi:hypothetical protein